MVSNSDAVLEAQKSVALKVEEPEVDADRPWEDDLLNRHEIATRLTNLVANQEAPLTVSLHGQWGTGKTFMLRRWQKDLESGDQPYRAIYFNAWEDDFCDDPLLAFIGQLSDHFKESGYKALARRVVDVAIPLIKENLNNVVKTKTGITLKVEQFKNRRNTLVDNYNKERATKEELKEALGHLSKKVATETGHPLVFIVDELDRCRPTFAIELLERVKHIFDVSNIVFVFGLNRDELCKSLTSVYGDIKADVYLRRFFDFEFNLREVDSSLFAERMVDSFELGAVFQEISNKAGNPSHMYDFENFRTVCPRLWSAMGLSLRDIDYAVRLIALLARNMEIGRHTHPYLVALLVAFKFKRRHFYDSMVTGNLRTNEVINYLVNESVLEPADGALNRDFDRLEGFLYCADRYNPTGSASGNKALVELQRTQGQDGQVQFDILSNRARNSDQERCQRITQAILDGQELKINRETLGQLAKWIDTYQEDLRR